MLLLAKSSFYITAVAIIILTQLFRSFGTLNGMELPLELLQQDHANGAKSRDYARRMAFLLASADNNDVVLPPNIEENLELNSSPSYNNAFSSAAMEDNDDIDVDGNMSVSDGMPKWLEMQLQTDPHQHSNNLHTNILHKQSNKHQHKHQHIQNNRQTHTPSPRRRCSIEITNKISGICQSMGTIGNACVSGDYIDVFNTECL